jgi:hypothetical protein
MPGSVPPIFSGNLVEHESDKVVMMDQASKTSVSRGTPDWPKAYAYDRERGLNGHPCSSLLECRSPNNDSHLLGLVPSIIKWQTPFLWQRPTATVWLRRRLTGDKRAEQ